MPEVVKTRPEMQEARMMKAIVQDKYGPPAVLRLDDRPIPAPRDDEVLVKVFAASVNAADWHLMRGTPLLIRLMLGGLRRPAHKGLGVDVAGRVEAVGTDVERFQPGDEVYGDLSEHGFGGFAEYACVSEDAFGPKPASLSFEDAAAVPVAGVTALQALRDEGEIQSGQQVLVNGASGGVGSFAVQIAKALGATVTGVCSTDKMAFVHSLGADAIIDYTQTDVTKQDQRYDLVLDAAAYRSPLRYLRILRSTGAYVLVGGATSRLFQTLLVAPVVSMIGEKSLNTVMAKPNPEDLATLTELIEEGRIVPAIDRRFPLSEVPAAIRYLEDGRPQGKVVITV